MQYRHRRSKQRKNCATLIRYHLNKPLVHGVQVVGFGLFPTSATEFIEMLNRTVQRDMSGRMIKLTQEREVTPNGYFAGLL
jgi:hypothetical protein